MRIGAAAVATLLVLTLGGRIYLDKTAPPSPEQTAGLSEPESAILHKVNQERLRHGLRPMAFSPHLTVVARGHSYDMAIRHYRSQKTPEGSSPGDRLRGVGIAYQQIAESIYAEKSGKLEGIAERAIAGWLASAEDRANLLSSEFVATGIGIARSSDGYTYVTQDFVR